MTRRLEKPRKPNLSPTWEAHARLRALDAACGLSNSYLPIVLLERLDDIADPDTLDRAFRDFIAEHGAPERPRYG